jgi:hypothetical protein
MMNVMSGWNNSHTVDSSIMVYIQQGHGFYYTATLATAGGPLYFVRFTGKFEGFG